MQKTLLALFFVIKIPLISFSQQANVDSLLTVLHAAKEDSNKVKLYRKIGNLLAYQDTRKAIEHWMQGAYLAKRLNFKTGAADCYLNISTGYSFIARTDSSLMYMDTAIQYIRDIGNPDRLALFYLNRADTYVQLRDFEQALKDCDTAMFYAEKANNRDRFARIYHNMSNIYKFQHQYKPSLEYLTRALLLYQQLGNAQMTGMSFNSGNSVIHFSKSKR